MKFSSKKALCLVVIFGGLGFSSMTYSKKISLSRFKNKVSSAKEKISSSNIIEGFDKLQKGLNLAAQFLAVAIASGQDPKVVIMTKLNNLRVNNPERYMMVMMSWQAIRAATGYSLDDLINLVKNNKYDQLMQVLMVSKGTLDATQRAVIFQLMQQAVSNQQNMMMPMGS